MSIAACHGVYVAGLLNTTTVFMYAVQMLGGEGRCQGHDERDLH